MVHTTTWGPNPFTCFVWARTDRFTDSLLLQCVVHRCNQMLDWAELASVRPNHRVSALNSSQWTESFSQCVELKSVALNYSISELNSNQQQQIIQSVRWTQISSTKPFSQWVELKSMGPSQCAELESMCSNHWVSELNSSQWDQISETESLSY